MKLSSKTILKALFLCSVVAVAHGREQNDDNPHYEDPDEIDVDFIPLCQTNEAGFGGDISSNSFTVEYWYELQYLTGGDSADSIISSIEKESGDFLLNSDLFEDPCRRRKLEVRPVRRRLAEAVGITSNPDDEVMEGVACSSTDTSGSGTSCVVVAASFQVYTDDSDNSALQAEFEETIEESINEGDVEYTNPAIVSVTVVDEPGSNSGNSANKGQINQGGGSANTTPVIIGATVGAVLILGAVALYRRRQTGSTDETAFSQPTTASPV